MPIGVIILYVCKIRCLHAPYVVGETLIVCLGGMNLLQDDLYFTYWTTFVTRTLLFHFWTFWTISSTFWILFFSTSHCSAVKLIPLDPGLSAPEDLSLYISRMSTSVLPLNVRTVRRRYSESLKNSSPSSFFSISAPLSPDDPVTSEAFIFFWLWVQS